MSIYEQIVLKLKVIGKLADQNNKDCKLTLRGTDPGLDAPGSFTWITRWFSGDGKDSTVQFITRTLAECSELIYLNVHSTFLTVTESNVTEYQRQKASDTINVLQSVSLELERAVEGIESLKKTYKDHSTTHAKLDIQKTNGQRLVMVIANEMEKCSKKFGLVEEE